MLKKRIASFLLALILLVNLAFSAQAVSPRILSISPGLTFRSGVAHCEVNVSADYTTDSIFVIAKLFDEDGNGVKTWVQSGSGYVNLYRTIEVTSGVEYTLKAYVTVNDVSKPTVSVTGTCP